MKKYIIVFLVRTLIIAFSLTLASAAPEWIGTEVDLMFKLPASLQYIEENAFEGTTLSNSGFGASKIKVNNGPETVALETAAMGNHFGSQFKLPDSLLYIEDEAFAGTVVERIEMPEGVQEIGNRAFADNPHLKSVYIPDSVTHISADAFTGSRQVMITASSGSYARTWASENAITFAPAIVMYAGIGNTTWSVLSAFSGTPEAVMESGNTCVFEEKTNWSAVAEITALRYEECLANHVAGRSPPSVG